MKRARGFMGGRRTMQTSSNRNTFGTERIGKRLTAHLEGQHGKHGALQLRIVGIEQFQIRNIREFLLHLLQKRALFLPHECRSLFHQEINARGTTVVMATHNPDFYLNSPFRRLVLDHGELLNRDLI